MPKDTVEVFLSCCCYWWWGEDLEDSAGSHCVMGFISCHISTPQVCAPSTRCCPWLRTPRRHGVTGMGGERWGRTHWNGWRKRET